MTNTDKKDKIIPQVMKWGGCWKHINLTNTCTIDNGLTILHLFYIENEQFRYLISSHQSEALNTLSTVMTLMSEHNYDQAKLVWAKLSPNVSSNLFGDEADFMMSHLDKLWKSKIISTCTRPSCSDSFIEYREEYGFRAQTADSIDDIQQLVDKWMHKTVSCASCVSDTEDNQGIGEVCNSVRKERRQIVEKSPVLVVRVYEHVLHDRLLPGNLMRSKQIKINDDVFKLAGITMYKEGHFCAIVFVDGVMYWYDGLVGKLSCLPSDYSSLYFPTHAIFCQIK
ncbi:hypothetical protein ACF0H5_010522 [Mactra antiquata]